MRILFFSVIVVNIYQTVQSKLNLILWNFCFWWRRGRIFLPSKHKMCLNGCIAGLRLTLLRRMGNWRVYICVYIMRLDKDNIGSILRRKSKQESISFDTKCMVKVITTVVILPLRLISSIMEEIFSYSIIPRLWRLK